VDKKYPYVHRKYKIYCIFIFVKTSQWIFRGRAFKEEEIEIIKEVIKHYSSRGRKAVARIICERLNW
jgi:hypothetical protein